MTISMIAAMSENRVIGKDNQIPWRLPKDMAYFKQTTMGHTIVAGRRNYEAWGNRPLPGRKNVILSRKWNEAQGAEVAHSKEEVLRRFGDEDELFIVGGEEIYRLFLPEATRIYLTIIHETFDGDTYFPELDMTQWNVVSEKKEEADSSNRYAHTYYIYERQHDVSG